MSATGVDTFASRLGVNPGDVVQEIGWDDDADCAISEAIEDAIGAELLDEDADDPCDTILLWFRDGDGDLVDDARGRLHRRGPAQRDRRIRPAGWLYPDQGRPVRLLAGLLPHPT